MRSTKAAGTGKTGLSSLWIGASDSGVQDSGVARLLPYSILNRMPSFSHSAERMKKLRRGTIFMLVFHITR